MMTGTKLADTAALVWGAARSLASLCVSLSPSEEPKTISNSFLLSAACRWATSTFCNQPAKPCGEKSTEGAAPPSGKLVPVTELSVLAADSPLLPAAPAVIVLQAGAK